MYYLIVVSFQQALQEIALTQKMILQKQVRWLNFFFLVVLMVLLH